MWNDLFLYMLHVLTCLRKLKKIDLIPITSHPNTIYFPVCLAVPISMRYREQVPGAGHNVINDVSQTFHPWCFHVDNHIVILADTRAVPSMFYPSALCCFIHVHCNHWVHLWFRNVVEPWPQYLSSTLCKSRAIATLLREVWELHPS